MPLTVEELEGFKQHSSLHVTHHDTIKHRKHIPVMVNLFEPECPNCLTNPTFVSQSAYPATSGGSWVVCTALIRALMGAS